MRFTTFDVGIQLLQSLLSLLGAHFRHIWMLIVEILLEAHELLLLPVELPQVLAYMAHAVRHATGQGVLRASIKTVVPKTAASEATTLNAAT